MTVTREQLDEFLESERKRGKEIRGRAWRTAKGDLVLIEEMDDSHLENAINYQESRGVLSVGIVARLKGRQAKTPEEVEASIEAGLSTLTKSSYEKYLELLAEREWRRNTCGFNPTQPSEHLGSKSFPLPRTTKK